MHFPLLPVILSHPSDSFPPSGNIFLEWPQIDKTHTADQLLYQDHKVAGNFRLRKTPSPKLPKGDKVNPMLTLVKIDIPFFRRSTVGY